MIISKDNKKIKYVKNLYQNKYRRKYNQFVVEGFNLVEMAKKSGCVDYVLTIDESVDGILISKDIMKSLVSTSSIVSVIAVCNYPEFNFEYNRVLVLDDIQDPGNLGTLIRSAHAFKFDAVVCSLNTVDLYNDKTVRSTGGSLFYMPVIYTDIDEYLSSSTHPNIGTFIDGTSCELNYDKFNLVLGNEGHGISDSVASKCSVKYRIEMNDEIDSLNVGVAGSILMWKLGG